MPSGTSPGGSWRVGRCQTGPARQAGSTASGTYRNHADFADNGVVAGSVKVCRLTQPEWTGYWWVVLQHNTLGCMAFRYAEA